MWVVLILCFLLCDFCANKAHKGVTIATGDFVYSARQSSQELKCGGVAQVSKNLLSQMAKELCTFHHRHGLNIRLLEDGAVALRVNSHNNGIVFTEQPIPNEYMFQVEVVKQNDKGYPESLRIGVTTISPDEAEIPSDALAFCSKSDYWMLRNNQIYNSDYGMILNFDINSLSVGQSVGLSVNPNGKLSFYVDGKFHDIVWRGLPTGMKYWGVADVYGPVSSIKSSFIFLPSLRRPHRARMLAVRSYSDKHSLHKESRFSFPTISTKERKFKIGDHVIVPTKEKKMLTGIVRWTGGVMMSQEAKEVIAVGVETDDYFEDDKEYFDLYLKAINTHEQAFFKVDFNHGCIFRPEHLILHAKEYTQQQQIAHHQRVKIPSSEDNESPLSFIEAKKLQSFNVQPKETLKEQLVLQERVFQNQIAEIKKENQKLIEIQQLLQDSNQQLEQEKQTLIKENADLQIQITQKGIEIMQLKRQLAETTWKVSHNEITLTEEELGRGGWGVIKIGIFREQRVAVKQMYQVIMSSDNLELIYREINTMATLRHPNILQFIGAVLDDPSGNPMIITEVMDTTLRNAYINRELIPDPSCQPTLLTIMRDVAAGLNYLHCLHDPIIHRDISSSNVLLEYKGHQKWVTKISDFGSANKAHKAVTIAAGAFVYSAPESSQDIIHKEQTTKMDCYSYGILLCEIMTCRFPDLSVFQEMLRQMFAMSRNIYELILSCIKKDPEARPSMKRIIERLDICRKQI